MSNRVLTTILTLAIAVGAECALAAPAAQYSFGGTLASDTAGAPALVSVDPAGVNGFTTDTVFGQTRTVFSYGGTTTPANQGGLTLATGTLLTSPSTYTVNMVFSFLPGGNAGGWQRILDASNRQSDDGLYISPSGALTVYPAPVGGQPIWTNGVYHDVTLVDNNGSVSGYLDGVAQFTAVATTAMDLGATNLLTLFLDNTVGGGQGEWSPGRIALLQVFDSALDGGTIATLAANPFVASVPEPRSAAMLLSGLVLIALVATRRRVGRGLLHR